MLKEVNSEYSLEGLMLKLQYFGHLKQTANSLEKTLMLAKNEGRRRTRWQRMRWLDSITDSMELNLDRFQEMVKDMEAWCAAVHGITESDRTWWLNKFSHTQGEKARWSPLYQQCCLKAYSHRHPCSSEGLAPHNQQPCLISFLPFIKFLVILLHLEKI